MSTFDVLAEIEQGFPFDEVSSQEVGASRPTQPESAPCGAPASTNPASLKASAPTVPSTSTGPTPPPTEKFYVSYGSGCLVFEAPSQEEARAAANRWCCPNPAENVR